jgi:hypothetical protein
LTLSISSPGSGRVATGLVVVRVRHIGDVLQGEVSRIDKTLGVSALDEGKGRIIFSVVVVLLSQGLLVR